MTGVQSVETAGDVLQKWPYRYVVKEDKCEVRRYRDLLYTKWQDGKFVEFVYAIDGQALFEERKSTLQTMKGGGGKLPFYTVCFESEKEYITWSTGHTGMVKVENPQANRIYCYVDKYAGDRPIVKYELVEWNGKLINFSDKLSDLQTETMIMNEKWEKESDAIDAEYRTRYRRRNDLEYDYLQVQMNHIDHIMSEGISCALQHEELKKLQERTTTRLVQMGWKKKEEKKEEVKTTGGWRFSGMFGSKQHMQGMLDELQRLGE
jgi:hypothetical protein